MSEVVCVYQIIVKRMLDFSFAFILFILFFPIMVIIAILIKFDSEGPVIFVQKRSGKNEKIFDMYKFRTMSKDNNVLDFKKENQITKIGKILRKTSLDELPQLINILKGEMSFVGPRPWIEDYSKFFTRNQKRRLEVLPGLTGLAQVSGRNDITVKEKLKLDVYYVDHMSFYMDLKIVIKTALEVLKKTGCDQSKNAIKVELDELKGQFEGQAQLQ